MPEFDLELFKDENGISGQQYPCVEAKGFIDLLTLDRKTGGFTVVELKRGRASREAVAQISTYMGWARERLAGGLPVRGPIISDGYDEKFTFARAAVPDLHHLELAVVRAKLRI